MPQGVASPLATRYDGHGTGPELDPVPTRSQSLNARQADITVLLGSTAPGLLGLGLLP